MQINAMSNAKEIGERLKKARLKAGYNTIEQFIKAQKIPRTTYTQYEAGSRSMSVERISEICAMLNTNLIWIIMGEGNPSISNQDLIDKLDDSTHLKANQEERLSIDDFIALVKKNGKESTKGILKKSHQENSAFIDEIVTNVKHLFFSLKIKESLNDIIRISTEIYLISKKEVTIDDKVKNIKHL